MEDEICVAVLWLKLAAAITQSTQLCSQSGHIQVVTCLQSAPQQLRRRSRSAIIILCEAYTAKVWEVEYSNLCSTFHVAKPGGIR